MKHLSAFWDANNNAREILVLFLGVFGANARLLKDAKRALDRGVKGFEIAQNKLCGRDAAACNASDRLFWHQGIASA